MELLVTSDRMIAGWLQDMIQVIHDTGVPGIITGRPLMAFLDYLDTHTSSIQVPDPAFRVYR